jgi:hypothetical protein
MKKTLTVNGQIRLDKLLAKMAKKDAAGKVDKLMSKLSKEISGKG